MRKSPETFGSDLDSLQAPPEVPAASLAALRARVEREPDAAVLLQALGFEDYEVVERLNRSGAGITKNANLKRGVRRAQFGGDAS